MIQETVAVVILAAMLLVLIAAIVFVLQRQAEMRRGQAEHDEKKGGDA